jgi:dephospho-CoA kinase
MKRIAVTGGIACGKSALARFLQEAGCAIWDADEVVHRLEAPGGVAVQPITNAFGADVLASAGGVDRAALGALVFRDAAALRRLNAILHPLVLADLREWLELSGQDIRVAVIPLLFEVGWDRGWDAMVCVTCRPEVQMARLAARGMTPDAARSRLAAQLPLDEKARRATYTLENNGTLDDLRAAALRLLAQWAPDVQPC